METPLLQAYRKRLELPILAEQKPLDLLNQLHLQHSFKVPFENLTIMLGGFPSLEIEDLSYKILVKNHGGYCFEVNGLFYDLLSELGYEVYCLCARILFGSVRISYRSHQLLLIRIEGQDYIADVGYRNGILMPIPLVFETEFQQYSECFRLIERENKKSFPKEIFLQKKILGNWENLYSFFLTPYEPIDFKPLNYCTATLPHSTFTTKRIVSLKTPEGSQSLLDNIWVELKYGMKTEIPVNSSKEYQKILNEQFGLALSSIESERLFHHF